MTTFNSGLTGDNTDLLANQKSLIIDIFHVPTKTSVQFKAFVTSYQDKFESSYNSEEVYGRMDPIQTFKGTKRTISLGWDVVSASEEDAIQNLNKCTTLFSMLYPTYEGATVGAATITSGPIFRLKFVNLIQDVSRGASGASPAEVSGLVGTISGFTYEPDFDSGFFDSGIGNLFPQTIKLSCEYVVNHTHGLGWKQDGHKREEHFPYNLTGEASGVSTPTAPSSTDPDEAAAAAAAMSGG